MDEQSTAVTSEVSDSAVSGDEGSVPSQDAGVSGESSKEDYVSKREYNKLMEERRKTMREINELKKYREDNSKAVEFYERLSENPDKLQKVWELLQAKQESDSKESDDPYADWDELPANKFRELDELRKWKEEVERREQLREQHYLMENRKNLDDHFYNMLVEDGHIDKNGKYDEKFVNTISKAVKGELLEIAKNPYAPTLAELKKAHAVVREALSSYEKTTLKRNVTPNVPPTGSKTGQMPTGKQQFKSDLDRVNYLMSKVKGGV